MMTNSLWAIILLCISMSIDNFLVGLNFSLTGKYIPMLGVTLISFMNAVATFITIFFGIIILQIVPLSISSKLSAFIFLWLAYKEFKGFFSTDKNIPNNYKNITWTDIYLLGLALCCTNIAGGIAAGIAEFPIFITTIICFIITYILMESGQLIGNKISTSLHFNNSNLSLVSASGFFLIGINNLL